MKVRFNLNSDGEPHIHDHNVSEDEVYEALGRPLLQTRGRDESAIVIGRTDSGRILKIIFADARDEDGIFVITAYDLPGKQLRAVRRRLKRKPR